MTRFAARQSANANRFRIITSIVAAQVTVFLHDFSAKVLRRHYRLLEAMP